MALPRAKKARNIEEVRAAAELLSYAYVLRGKSLPSASTSRTVDHDVAFALAQREKLLTYPTARDEKFFPLAMVNYLDALRIIKEEVRGAAVDAAGKTLDRQVRDLVGFSNRLARDEVADRIHDIAEHVRIRMNGFLPSSQDQQQAESKYGPATKFDRNTFSNHPNPQFFPGVDEFFQARLRAELARELQEYARGSAADRSRPTQTSKPSPDLRVLRKEAADVCAVLSLHPDLQRILEYYAQSAAMGTRLARRLVDEALAASAEFGANLYVSEDMVWRYPPLIVLGIKQMGLDDIDGFTEFATDFAYVISEDKLGSILTTLGFATFILGILLTGPLAASGIALVDLALVGASLPLTFLREREQDVVATSGTFSSTPYAKRREYPYAGTAFAAFATLLSGIAFVFSGVRLASSLRPRARGILAARTPALAERTATSAASEVPPGSRARYREMPAPVNDGKRFRPARDIGSRGQPDPARSAAAGDFEGPINADARALAKPTEVRAPAQTGTDTAVASASKSGASKAPAPLKGPSVAAGGGGTSGSTSAGGGSSKSTAKPKPSPAPKPYNRRKAAEALVLQNEADIWTVREDYRGLYIQSRLAKSEYKDYFEPLLRNRPETDDWFPMIDFVSNNEKHVVSLKTYNPYTKKAALNIDESFVTIQKNAQEMVEYNWPPGVRGTLDIRIPPGAHPNVVNNLKEALSEFIGKGTIKLDVVIRTYP